jgi:hypothetical protein
MAMGEYEIRSWLSRPYPNPFLGLGNLHMVDIEYVKANS